MNINSLGLVINRRYYSENDKLVTLYTKELGKINAIAVGSRRINAKMLAATEPVTEAEYALLSSQSGIVKIVGGKTVSVFPELKNNFKKYVLACKVLEVVNLLTFENLKNEDKYNLIHRALELVGVSVHPNRVYSAFVLRFLGLSGYGLELSKCIKCSGKGNGNYRFSLKCGGILCDKCSVNSNDSFKIEKMTLTFLRNISKLSGNDVDSMEIPLQAEIFIENQCENYLSEYLPASLKTGKFQKEFSKIKF